MRRENALTRWPAISRRTTVASATPRRDAPNLVGTANLVGRPRRWASCAGISLAFTRTEVATSATTTEFPGTAPVPATISRYIGRAGLEPATNRLPISSELKPSRNNDMSWQMNVVCAGHSPRALATEQAAEVFLSQPKTPSNPPKWLSPHVRPSLWPSSTSAWSIQRRKHDSLIPRSFAIWAIGFSRNNRANSTARRRNSSPPDEQQAFFSDSFPLRRSSPQPRCPGERELGHHPHCDRRQQNQDRNYWRNDRKTPADGRGICNP